MSDPMKVPSRARIDVRDLRADDLRYVLAVSRSGTLIAAADTLEVNHTTVARRVRALEQVIGERVIERGPDGWVLTDLGRAIASSAQSIESSLERVVDLVSGAEEPLLHGTVRVSAPDGFGTTFVTPALANVRAQHPALRIELATATRDLTGHATGFDLAVVIGDVAANHVVTEHLTDYSLGLYASEEYIARRGVPGGVSELRDHVVIFYIDSMLQSSGLGIARHLPMLSPTFTSTNVFAQVEATRLGVGIGVLPAFLARRAGLVRLLPEGVDIHLPIALVTRRDATSFRPMLVVRAAIREQAIVRKHELLPPLGAG